MRRCIALLVIAVAGAAAAPAAGEVAQAKLIKERIILPGGTVFADETGPTSVQLSPDGRYVVYIDMEPVKAAAAGAPRQALQLLFRIAVRDLKSGKDTPLPMPATPEYEFLDIALSLPVFDPAGRKIVVPAGIDKNGDGRHDPKTEKMQAMIYDLSTGKTARLGPAAQVVMPVFGRAGKCVVVVAGDRTDRDPKLLQMVPVGEGKSKQLAVTGMPLSPCPTADVLPLILPPEAKGAQKVHLGLYDLKADKVVQRLPYRSKYMRDPFRPSWTGDGRYFCYSDEQQVKVAGGTQTKRVCRVWDRIAGKEAAVLSELTPVGPGPGKTTIVLFRSPDRHKMPLVVYDVAAGKQWPLGDKSIVKALSTQGKYVVYAKASATGGINICAAEIVLPAAAASRPAPARKKSAERAAALKKNVDDFIVRVTYGGRRDARNPHPSVTLFVSDRRLPRYSPPDSHVVPISKVQALRLIEHLAATGVLGSAEKALPMPDIARSDAGPSYVLVIGDPRDTGWWEKDLGWDLKMLERLAGLRKILDGDAAKAMDTLIKALEPQRKKWQKPAGGKPAANPSTKAPGRNKPPDTLPMGPRPLGKIPSVRQVVRGGYTFIAICEALNEPQAVSAATGAYQKFKVQAFLDGTRPAGNTFNLNYHYFANASPPERPVRKGEKVIWIVRKRADPYHGARPLAYTPENHKAVLEAVLVERGAGKAVNGLKLTLRAAKATTAMRPDGRSAEPVLLAFTFANVGDKPIKLQTSDHLWPRLHLHVTGPGGKSVRITELMLERIGPTKVTYWVLKAGHSVTYSKRFPGQYFGYKSHDLLKLGAYRIWASYPNIVGVLASNEITLTVKAAPAAKPAVKWGKAVGGLVCGISAFKKNVQLGVPYEIEASIKNISKGDVLLLKRRFTNKEPLHGRVYFMQAGTTYQESFIHDPEKFAVGAVRQQDFVLLRPGDIYKFTHETLVYTGPMPNDLKKAKGGLGLMGLTREGTYLMQVRYHPWFTLAKGADLGGLKPWKGVLVSAPVEVVVPKDPAKPAVKWGKAVGGLVCGISAFKPKVQLGVPYQFEVSVKNISKGGIVLFKRRLGDGYYRVILARAGKQYREYYTIDSKAMARPAASARDLVRLKPKEIYKFTHKTVIASEYKHRRPSLGFIGGVAEGTYQMRVRYEPWERRIAKGVDLGGLKPWKGVLLSAPVEVIVGKDPAKPAHPAAKGRKLFDKADARNFALTLSHSSMRGVNVVGLSTAKPRSQSWHAHTYPQISKAEAAKIIDYMNKSTWPVWPDARGVKFADDESFIVAAQSGPRLVVVDLRWGAKTLQWVKGLQVTLRGPAAKAVGKMTGAIERYVREVAQPMAPAMAKLLHKGDLKKFSLQLQWTSRPGFLGGSKPFSYNLALTVGKPPKAGNQILSAQAQITEAQAGKIVDHLLKSGFYHRAVGMSPMTRQILRYPIGPAYTLTVWRGQGRGSVGNLGCGPRMLEHLDALRKVLDGEAAKAMDKLLASLAPDRKRWKAEGAMKPAQLAAHRAALLKKHSAMFRFWLACLVEPGQADRGSLTLSVPGLPKLLVVRRMYQAQISEAEAGKVIDYMAAEGYLTRAVCIPPRSGMVRSGPALIASAWHPDGYALTAASAWRAATLRKSFGALQKALPRISGAAKVFGALMTEQPAAGCSNPDHSPRTQHVETEPPVTRNVPPVQPRAASAPAKTSRVDYPSVFREAHRSVERWHVIRQHHLVSAIESLSTHGEGIAPFLIRLTKSERYGQRGWPFWALVCGTLAKVGGDEGATAMRNLKEDEKAYKHAREYAEKALAGEWPPDSANHRVERTR